MFSLSFTGIDATEKKAKAAVEEMLRRLGAAMGQEAEEVIGDAKEHYVPVDTGDLRDSGVVLPAERDGKSVVVRMGFNTDYAVAVHEDTTAYHEHGQAKYLTTPLLKRQPGLLARLARRMAK